MDKDVDINNDSASNIKNNMDTGSVDKNQYLRKLPKVDELLDCSEVRAMLETYPRHLVVDGIRAIVDDRRNAILKSTNETVNDIAIDLSHESIAIDLEQWLKKQFEPSMRRVINATGVVIHTNLGRSILSKSAIDAVVVAAVNYSNLEFDLEKGERGSRHTHIEQILTRITGAQSAMVVNNNASAVLIALSALACGKEAIVSRGQLVEIGGSFRIPDVMRQSGAKLVEVGTTNKTYASDYRVAVSEDTGLLMKVHPSNFRVLGFTHEVSLEELVSLGDELSIPVMEDLGSGVLIDLTQHGIEYEPTVQESVRVGVDVVTFSGDKLLGGPQAGLIVGKAEYIARMKKHPLARALRIDKMTLAALEATLREYLDLDMVCKKNPTLRMITMGEDELQEKARKLARLLTDGLGDAFHVSIESDVSRVGGGSLPLAELPTTVVSLKVNGVASIQSTFKESIESKEFGKPEGFEKSEEFTKFNISKNGLVAKIATVNEVEAMLRKQDIPVVVRIKEDAILLDPRTIQDGEENDILSAFMEAKRELGF